MIIRAVRVRSTLVSGRLDSRYFCAAGTQAHDRLAMVRAAGSQTAHLGGPGGLGALFAPNRFTRSYATTKEDSAPYLRPYDVFEYLPQPADWLSIRRTDHVDSYRLESGTILQSCSGRNLGPAVIVDRYLDRFLLSHDMIRVRIDDVTLRAFVLAYLNTSTAQALLRRDKTGSVIDHISTMHAAALEIPLFDLALRARVAQSMLAAIRLREEARLDIHGTIRTYEGQLPSSSQSTGKKCGWTVRARSLEGRLDAAFYNQNISTLKKRLLRAGGTSCAAVAETRIPGRYVRYYVGADQGTPILSGRQLLQVAPINLQYISGRSFRYPERYEIRGGWTALQAEGRSEERIGFPVMITSDRDGWLANNHIARLLPRADIKPGALFLAMAAEQTQAQVKALSTGSVVDSVGAKSLGQVIVVLPRVELCEVIEAAWDKFATAKRLQDEAVALIDGALNELSGEEQRNA